MPHTLPVALPSQLAVHPRRPGRPAEVMSIWHVVVHAKGVWAAMGTLLVGPLSGLWAMQSRLGADLPVGAGASSLVVPLIVVVIVQTAGLIFGAVMMGMKSYREFLRTERIKDYEADHQGAAAAATKARELEGALATRDQVIKELRGENDATVLHYKGVVAELRDQIAKQDARARDLIDQIASMADTMSAVVVDTKATREAVERVSPSPPTPEAGQP